jgi:hypothetical protein
LTLPSEMRLLTRLLRGVGRPGYPFLWLTRGKQLDPQGFA